MNKPETNDKWLWQWAVDADSGQACTALEFGSGSTKPNRGKLRFLLACAWGLTIALPAAAQDVEEKTPAAPPSAALPEAEPLPTESSAGEIPEASLPEEASAPRRAAGTERSLKEVVVTGYRKSLGAALEKKQNSTSQVDAIVAEDMADFPDLNLADSLQRIPGISVTRSSGESGRVTVRGLTGHYTRTRLNGMDAQASDVNNTTREFDFNLFASELFSAVLIHKTASPELGDGSLGAVIDLGTGRPFSFKKGFSAVASAQGNYNDLSKTLRPRMAGLLTYHDPGGLWGATASVAYSKSRNDEIGSDTVRWSAARFGSVKGVTCPVPDPKADPPVVEAPECAPVTNAFHARIPRYTQSVVVSERLGLTGGFQIKPIQQTEIRLDALLAIYNRQVDFMPIEVLFRGNEQNMKVTDYELLTRSQRDGVNNNDLTVLAVDNAWVRSEAYRGIGENKFYQLTLAVDHEFTSSVYAKALVGRTVSSAHRPHNTAMMYDNRDYNGFRYDYTKSRTQPVLSYGSTEEDVRDGSTFTLTDIRDQESTTRNTNDTAELKLFWEVIEAFKLGTGVTFKRKVHNTHEKRRDGSVCGLKLYQCDTDGDGKDDLLGYPGEAGLTLQTDYRGKVGAGSTTSWASPSIDGWVNRLNYYNVPLTDNQSAIRRVEESNIGGFLQADGSINLGAAKRLTYNGGVQYVQTRQKSGGYNSGTYVDLTRPMYQDWLPSANVAFWATNSLAFRASGAKVLARPVLSNLSPGGSVDSYYWKISYENPRLDPTRAIALDVSAEWYFAKEAVLSLAVFRKDIKSFPLREVRTGTFASTNLPDSVIAPTSPASQNLEGTCGLPQGCWEISTLGNGPGATINGLEIGFQAPFSSFYAHLPPVIRGLGIIANTTLVDSKSDYNFSGKIITERLLGLSNRAFNATLYYDSAKFGARISIANRSNYLTSGPAIVGNLWEFTESSTRVDFSSKYKITNQLEVSFEAMNLTDTPDNTQVDNDANRPLIFQRAGRNFLLGARYSY